MSHGINSLLTLYEHGIKMKKFSSDKNINELVKWLIKHDGWKLKKHNKHPMLMSPCGKTQLVPSSPSDYRAYENFKNDIRRIQVI